ncbi:MAG: multidrug ABC transporter ATP-binding protein, partial [Lachnospiraceae bacterium]|nr:multidrug ABC transporter ATP-binding protein [Lachnospiraceae bacterium]
GIAQAIMENPRILILDEPMNALDWQGVLDIRRLLLELKEDRIILIASHNREDIEILCDEVYEMEKGKLLER